MLKSVFKLILSRLPYKSIGQHYFVQLSSLIGQLVINMDQCNEVAVPSFILMIVQLILYTREDCECNLGDLMICKCWLKISKMFVRICEGPQLPSGLASWAPYHLCVGSSLTSDKC